MKRCFVKYNFRNTVNELELKWDIFRFDQLVVDAVKVRGWCSDGCPNYNRNGGCPPFSPTAEELLKNKNFILLTTKAYTKNINVCDKGAYIEELLSEYMNKLGYKIKDMYGVDFLCAGRCRGCSECSIDSGCSSPKRRQYCITGTGILLGDVIENLFEEKLQWFGRDHEPEYIMKIMGFISEKSSEFLKDELGRLII